MRKMDGEGSDTSCCSSVVTKAHGTLYIWHNHVDTACCCQCCLAYKNLVMHAMAVVVLVLALLCLCVWRFSLVVLQDLFKLPDVIGLVGGN